MRALALTLLAMTLALGHALPYIKGLKGPLGPKTIPDEPYTHRELNYDPDWVPPPDSDMLYYDEDEDDGSFYGDVIVYDDNEHEPDSYEGDDEDELWSSDDDPDWVPEGTSQEETSGEGDDEDELWSSDDDPDWVPEGTSQEETSIEDNQNSKEEKIGELDLDLIEELAEAMLLRADGRGTLENMIELIISLEMTREEALEALGGLRKMIAEEQDQEQGQEQGQEQEQDQEQGQEQEQGREEEQNPNQVDQTHTELDQPLPESESLKKRQLRHYKGHSQQQQSEYSQADQDDLAHGVEPLSPGSQGRVDVGQGVEAAASSIGNWIRGTWRDASEVVEDLGDRAQDTFRDIGDSISDAVGTAVDTVHETAAAAGEHIVSTYEKAKEKLAILKERLSTIFAKLGVTIRLGAEYCFLKLAQTVDQVRGSLVFEKLEAELEKGNEQVSEFFSVLGQKIAAWQDEHPGTDIDAGLIHHSQQEGGQLGETVDGTQQGEQAIPEFFWDQQVVNELDKLVDQGVLTQDDLLAFPLQQSQQGHLRKRRERKMRSWVDSLRQFA